MTPANDTEREAELATPLAETVRPVPRLQYLHSYTFVFDGDDGLLNLALVSLCLAIPVIGPIVLAGYQYEIVCALHRNPKQIHPVFDFGRFGEYLGRGVWKFLADIVMQMFLTPIFLVVIYGGMGLIVVLAMVFAGNQGQNLGPAIGITSMIIVPLVVLFILAVTVAVRLVTNPLILKASLSGEGADLFDVPFMIDFVKRTWRETLLELLWVYVTFPILIAAGLLFCLVGVLPATGWAMLADAHTNWQLYEIYLARGGRPIRLRSDRPRGAATSGVAKPYQNSDDTHADADGHASHKAAANIDLPSEKQP